MNELVVSRRRRFLAMALDWLIVAGFLFVKIIIYLLFLNKIDFSNFFSSFSTQYEQILEGGL